MYVPRSTPSLSPLGGGEVSMGLRSEANLAHVGQLIDSYFIRSFKGDYL